MTTPHQPPPDSAYVIGGGEYRYGQDLTEEIVKQILKTPVLSGYSKAQTDLWTLVVTQAVLWAQTKVGELINTLNGGAGSDLSDAAAWVASLLDSVDVEALIADAIHDIADGFDAVETVGSGLAGAITSFIGGLNLTNGVAGDAQAGAIAAQAALQALQAGENAGGSNGFNWATTFSGVDGAALNPADWTTTTLEIRGPNGHAGIDAGQPDGTYHAITTAQYTADGQSVSIVLGDNRQLLQNVGIYLRCNSTGTQGAGLLISSEGLNVVYFSRSGSSWSYTGIGAGFSRTQRTGDVIELRAAGDTYRVYANGILLGSRTDSPSHVSQGAGFRYAMISMQRSTVALQRNDSFRIAAFAMSDSTVPAVLGTGWWLGRSSASSLAMSGSGAQFPAGTFDTNVATTANVTVQDLGRGEVIIPKTGWYQLYCAVVASGTIGSGLGTRTYKLGFKVWSSSAKTTLTYYMHGNPVVTPGGLAGDGGLNFHATAYLSAGQCIAPVWIPADTFSIKGNSDAATTMFSGTLTS